jgi:hypothetical protein
MKCCRSRSQSTTVGSLSTDPVFDKRIADGREYRVSRLRQPLAPEVSGRSRRLTQRAQMLFDKGLRRYRWRSPAAERVSCNPLFGSDTILVPTLTVAKYCSHQATAPLRMRGDPATSEAPSNEVQVRVTRRSDLTGKADPSARAQEERQSRTTIAKAGRAHERSTCHRYPCFGKLVGTVRHIRSVPCPTHERSDDCHDCDNRAVSCCSQRS